MNTHGFAPKKRKFAFEQERRAVKNPPQTRYLVLPPTPPCKCCQRRSA